MFGKILFILGLTISQVRCRLSPVTKIPQARLFTQLLDILKFYEGFEINNITGNSLTDTEVFVCTNKKTKHVRREGCIFTLLQMSATHADRIQALQRLAFKHFPELKELALANIASIDTKSALLKHLRELSDDRYDQRCVYRGKR